MRALANLDARDRGHAVELSRRSRAAGKAVAFAGGGSDLLGQIKERQLAPDVLVNLKSMPGLDQVEEHAGGLRIGGLITLDALARHPLVRARHAVLAEAAASVATPQIRNVATLAGNLCQRPWCWYYRGGFPCFKNGGSVCYALTGENQHHAIFGGGPSYIVHPSDTASALVASGASFRLFGPEGERELPASEFFRLPHESPERENALRTDELLLEVLLPAAPGTVSSSYFKLLDRESWTHAVVAVALVLQLEAGSCRRAALVLGGVAPVPWRVGEVEALLAGRRITPQLAAEAGALAVRGAAPLAHNGYKVALTRAAVTRTLRALAGAA